MTKAQLIELIKYRLTGIFTANDMERFHDEIISFNIGRAFNQLLGEMTSKGYKNLSPYTKLFKGTGTGIAVSQDSDTEQYYSLIPVDISTLTDVKSGVRKIQTLTGTGVEFAPVDNEMISIIDGLEVSTVDDIIGYTVGKNEDGDLVVWYSWMDDSIDYVKMYLVIPFEAYEDNDMIHIPAGMDERLLQMVIEFLAGTPVTPKVNDNS